MPESIRPAPTGADLLHNPHLNRGTAFPLADRRALHIEGLLPPAADTLADRKSPASTLNSHCSTTTCRNTSF